MNHMIEYGGITECLTPYIATSETRPFSIMPSADNLCSVVCCYVTDCGRIRLYEGSSGVNASETVEVESV